MYKRLAEKITNLIIDALKKEKLLETANNGEVRPANGKIGFSKALSERAKPSNDPELAERVRKRNPHWFRPDSLEVVVRMMLEADSNPTRKAQAARALRSYSRKRAVEIRSTPKRVTAGVRAAVTKRRQKAK